MPRNNAKSLFSGLSCLVRVLSCLVSSRQDEARQDSPLNNPWARLVSSCLVLDRGAQQHNGCSIILLLLAAEYWGSLAGIDGAALVEVVEHLDPTPLHNLGPCLLGGLQPKLLVVTTPNKEYNAVLHQLGNALLPNKLRNTDHRFEW